MISFFRKNILPAALIFTSASTLSCRGLVRADIIDTDENLMTAKILSDAMLAPSGHNTQPWTVKIISQSEWIIGWDKSRSLPAVDPKNRELLLSVGAFCEAVKISACAQGLSARIVTTAKTNFDEDLVKIYFEKSVSDKARLEELRNRRTVRKGLLEGEITEQDRNYLSSKTKSKIYFYKKGSAQGNAIEQAVLQSNIVQAKRKDAAMELAKWIRWKDKDAASLRNGLTPESMEIHGLANLYVRNFFSADDVLTESFEKQTISSIQSLLKTYGCWVIVATENSQPGELISAGSDFLQLGLCGYSRNIGIHPMTQPLEEDGFAGPLQHFLGIKGHIQFILRCGYVEKYPKPVSVRMNYKEVLK